ncbi:MAG: carbon starvation protein A [Phycisphaerae bacterium]|nr:carbon starvation protein A [Phycisphaerae bacterium]
MLTLLIAVGAFVAYIIAYHTYGRWLGRKVFQLSKDAVCPSVEINDGRDYVPTKREVIFGHHFTSIAGTGPIVGPAIAVFWGWLPALLWVLLGSIFIGAVHDFGALVVSLRNRGQTIGDVAARIINPRARILLLLVLFLVLMVVIGIFGLVIAVIFTLYPISVFAIWIEIPIAIAVGYLVYKRGGNILILSLIALTLMYLGVCVGAYWLPLDLSQFSFLEKYGSDALQAGLSPYANTVVVWTVILLIYCFIASVLPVWTLLQPRDFINSHQLFVALALIFVGLFVTALSKGGLEFVTEPITKPPGDAPPFIPFLFITIACGAVSGFHCLVSSGTSSKQVRRETDAQLVGYGSMLLESGLAVVVILACTAAIGKGLWTYDDGAARYVERLGTDGSPIVGVAAWHELYGQHAWKDMTLGNKVGAFVEGGANLLHSLGIPITLAIGVMAVLIASFAATTLDTATRLQRYVITELGGVLRLPMLRGRYVATAVAVLTGGGIALTSGPLGPGSGGKLLWPIFGATNQLLAGLSFLVLAFYLLRHKRPVWFVILPMALMLVVPGWAMCYEIVKWWQTGKYLLFGLGLAVEVIQIWIIVEGILMWPKAKGVLPEPLPHRKM